jgi:dynein heavy chain 1, cytosolic
MLYTAQDYNQLMKDIPIPLEELSAATNLDEVRTAIADICGSLEKIRNTKYPLKRAIQFFTTISTDLCKQIIQVSFNIFLLNLIKYPNSC